MSGGNTSKGIQQPCWNNLHCMELTRSLRLECFCKDSFALFANFNVNQQFGGTNVNRRGNCSNLESWWKLLSNFTNLDWRVEEFFRNGEESQNVCFRNEVRRSFNGTGIIDNNECKLLNKTAFVCISILLTCHSLVLYSLFGLGSRVILRIKKISKLGDEKNLTIPSLVNFKVEFEGLPGWASGFILALEYFQNVAGNETGDANLDGDTLVDKTLQRNRIYFLSQGILCFVQYKL